MARIVAVVAEEKSGVPLVSMVLAQGHYPPLHRARAPAHVHPGTHVSDTISRPLALCAGLGTRVLAVPHNHSRVLAAAEPRPLQRQLRAATASRAHRPNHCFAKEAPERRWRGLGHTALTHSVPSAPSGTPAPAESLPPFRQGQGTMSCFPCMVYTSGITCTRR